MKVLVTGSAGHLGEALVRTLSASHEIIGFDVQTSPFTKAQGSITDRAFVRAQMAGVDAVLHTATLHKPHVATHPRQAFIDTNITGTLNLLEESVAAGVRAFIFTSTTSVFGRALTPAPGEPAAWITEDVRPVPKNIYGVTKAAAEDLCELFHHKSGLPSLVLRTSRFFPEPDDDEAARAGFEDLNLKTNEFLFRRVDIEDVLSAHERALESAERIGFGRYIISATSPFTTAHLAALRTDAPSVVTKLAPDYAREYERRGWKMSPSIGRVYVNERARADLHWRPKHDFFSILAQLRADEPPGGALARVIGAKGYHAETFAAGPNPTEK